jgi:hypothetical protein
MGRPTQSPFSLDVSTRPACMPFSFLTRFHKREVSMIAKIIIKRRFVKENTPQILSLLNKIRSIAMNQPGYISGETLMQADFPENMAVIATWQNMKYWMLGKIVKNEKPTKRCLKFIRRDPPSMKNIFLEQRFMLIRNKNRLDERKETLKA